MTKSAGLFDPFRLRSVAFRNRVIVSPMCQYIAEDGHAGRWHRNHHARFALGGVGGAILEATAVTRDGRITPGCLGLYKDAHVDALREIVEGYHAQGIPVGIQLSHAGRKGSAAVPLEGAAPLDEDDSRAWRTVAPSPIRMADGWQVPRELTEAEIETLIDAFAAAAMRAVDAGFDFIEVHGAHGYLLHSFVSPLSNHRDDGWGGSAEARLRFPLAIVRKLRAILPGDMPLLYRLSAIDGPDGGLSIEDNIAIAARLKEAGIDLIDCSSGGLAGVSGEARRPQTPGYLVPHAARIREGADMPVMAVGLIIDPRQADDIVAQGRADLVAIGRQLIAEPNFVHRAAHALNIENPDDVLPPAYAFFLKRRRIDGIQ